MVVSDIAAAKLPAPCSTRAADYDEQLWNGEYYVQRYDQVRSTSTSSARVPLRPAARAVAVPRGGPGPLLPGPASERPSESIFKYNCLTDFRTFSNVQRTYALNDEKGLLICTWPKGGRPGYSFVYSDEVWTGIEYQVAGHLIYEGLVEEGLAIVKGVRDRYDGVRRNPWNEIECGDHYARAMSPVGRCWTALSGQAYSGPEMRIGFEPKVNADDFRTVCTAGSGWGTYSQKGGGGKRA